MAGLKWVRLDTSFPHNQKILDLAHAKRYRAIAVYACSLPYAGAQGTDGWIPDSALPLIHGRPIDATHLVEVGLWIPRPGGWDINDWAEYQPSSEETAARTAKARAAAMTRWHGQSAISLDIKRGAL